jgi:NADH-quinone oxidoreductase subunit I
MKIQKLIRDVLLIEWFRGLSVTFKTMLVKPVTRLYPHVKRQPFPGFRGRQALVRDPEKLKERCIMCLRCKTVCPSNCISIEVGKDENNARVLKEYSIDATRCIYCAYCVEVCPVNALVLTEEYEYLGDNRSDLFFRKEKLLSDWDEFLANYPGDTYFNKFWRPPGMPEKMLTPQKRNEKPIEIKKKNEEIAS